MTGRADPSTKPGVGTYFDKRAILLQFRQIWPVDRRGWGGRRGATKLDAVLFFMRLHMNFKLNCTNLIIVVIIIKCKFKFQVLSNAERTTWKAKSHVCYVLTCVLKITKCVACAKNETMFSDVTLKRSWFQLIFETRCTHLLKIASWV